MATIQSSTDPRFKPEMSLRDRLAGILQGATSLLPTSMQSFPDIPQLGVEKGTLAESLMPLAENVPGISQAVSAEDLGQAAKDKSWLGMGLAGLGMLPGGRVEKAAIEEVPTIVKKLDKPAGQFNLKPEGKKLTKKERELAERKATLNRTIESRDLKPGKNVMPLVNPTQAELDAIRAEKGGSGMVGPKGTEKQVDPSQTAHLFPPASERTREQKALNRIERLDTTPRAAALVDNPAVRAAIKAAAEKGRHVQDWYDTTPLQEIFVKEFGPEEGMQRFSDFIGFVASTSPENKIGQNIKTGSHYYSSKYGGGRSAAEEPYVRGIDVQVPVPGTKNAKGVGEYGPKFEDVPQAFEVPPEGYGAKTQQTHMGNVNQWEQSGGLSSFDNPKIAAFYENLMGNWQPTTIDKHAVRVAAMGSRDPRWLTEQGRAKFAEHQAAGLPEEASINQLLETPTNWADIPDSAKGEYDAMEKMWTETAKEMGVTPAELQAMAWIGGGEDTGLGSASATFMQAFQDRIRRTAIEHNIPPDQVLQLMLHGKMTLAQLEQPGAQGTSAVG